MEQTKIQSLAQVASMPGYQVLREVFEAQLKKLESAVFQIRPQNTEEVLAAQRVAVGARFALEETFEEVARLVNPAMQQRILTQKELDELYLKSL